MRSDATDEKIDKIHSQSRDNGLPSRMLQKQSHRPTYSRLCGVYFLLFSDTMRFYHKTELPQVIATMQFYNQTLHTKRNDRLLRFKSG